MPPFLRFAPLGVVFVLLLAGCGTTRTTNTHRTATEQLLISDAIDRAVEEINFTPLRGQAVYFDDKHLGGIVDQGYLVSSLRQHLLASGCILKTERNEATYIVEPRAGAVGTDNHDLLFGMPAVNLPQVTMLAALPPAIPEIPIAKRRNQRGVAKIAVFAYHRETGEPAWQSGIATDESSANDIWVLGAGPFKKGTIYNGTSLAGQLTTQHDDEEDPRHEPVARVAEAAVYDQDLTRGGRARQTESQVQHATAIGEVYPLVEPKVLPPPGAENTPESAEP